MLVPVVVWGVLWVGAAQIATVVVPDAFDENAIPTASWLLGVFVVISIGLSLLAGWLGGKIAPKAIMRHVMILGIIQLLIGIGVQASVWDQMPVWYHLVFLAFVLPMHLIGGRAVASGSGRKTHPRAGLSTA